MTTTVPFQYLMHLLTIPVCVGDAETRFIFDTGIGVNLVSDSLARALGAEPSGSLFTGRRMSGQTVTAPMTSLDSVRLGDRSRRDVPAACATRTSTGTPDSARRASDCSSSGLFNPIDTLSHTGLLRRRELARRAP